MQYGQLRPKARARLRTEVKGMELLFYGGCAAMGAAALAGVAALVAFRLRAAKLKRTFEEEYGPQGRRHA